MEKYWLMKSEPDVYSIEDLKNDKKTFWDGIRNYQARNNMACMKKDDLILFYHSNSKPKGIAGIAKVTKEAYPDFTAQNKKSKYFDSKATKDNPIWQMVDIKFVEKFDNIITLEQIKQIKELKNMVLLKNSRLSVQPVRKAEFNCILQLKS